MKKFLFSLWLLFAITLHAETPAPDWLIYVGEDGKIEVYDDGCNGAVTIVYWDGRVENHGGPC